MTRTIAAWPLVVLAIVASPAHAQQAPPPSTPEPRHILQLSGGFGLSIDSEEDHDGVGSGGYLEAEYVYRYIPALTPRAYAGLLMTFPDEDSCANGIPPCDVQSKIFFLGVKLRLMAPIPYVGPFLELGLGASLGYLRTHDLDVDERARGAAVHIPFTLGIAFGRRHDVDVSLQYLVHPSVKQLGGALAIGVAIPLR